MRSSLNELGISKDVFDYRGNINKLDQLGCMTLIEQSIGKFFNNTSINYFGGMLIREWWERRTMLKCRRSTESSVPAQTVAASLSSLFAP